MLSTSSGSNNSANIWVDNAEVITAVFGIIFMVFTSLQCTPLNTCPVKEHTLYDCLTVWIKIPPNLRASPGRLLGLKYLAILLILVITIIIKIVIMIMMKIVDSN